MYISLLKWANLHFGEELKNNNDNIIQQINVNVQNSNLIDLKWKSQNRCAKL